MRTKSKNINTRVSEELYAAVDNAASEKRVNRSDIVRTVLEKEFLEKRTDAVASLSDEERQKIILEVAQTLAVVDQIRNNNVKFGNNVNQIAKAINSGASSVVSRHDVEVYRDFANQHKEALETFAEKVDKLWRILV